jgi:uncharacterized protein YdeI (YjbR/CyaY-like superfamily)
MSKHDPRVDAYIEKSAEFARPILKHIRSVVHAACPDVEETMKWSFPHFDYKGMLCSMAAFKQHCAFGFWKHSLVIESENGRSREAMGSFGRMTSIDELPSRAVLTRYIKKAMKLNDDGVKAVRDKTPKRKPARIPPALGAALAKNKKARAKFDAFSSSQQREYMEWIGEAKGEDTRARRLSTAIEWIQEGKTRYWKYAKC